MFCDDLGPCDCVRFRGSSEPVSVPCGRRRGDTGGSVQECYWERQGNGMGGSGLEPRGPSSDFFRHLWFHGAVGLSSL